MRIIDQRLHTLRVLQVEGTVTAAAAALHITPSTVSQHLHSLASDLDLVLLEHEGRRVRLTAAAHELLRHEEILAADWACAETQLDQHRQGVAGRIRVSAIASMFEAVLLPGVGRLQLARPGITVELSEDAREDRRKLLLTGQIDIAIVVSGLPHTGDSTAPSTGECASIESRLLTQEPMDVVVPLSHILANRTRVELSELSNESWIAAGDPRDQHKLLLAASITAGFTPRIVHEALDWNAVGALVAFGHGIALVPRFTPLRGSLIRLRLEGSTPPTRSVLSLTRRGESRRSFISDALDAFSGAASSNLV